MLEKVDEQLIAHLQRNGRATVAELGQAIGLSASSSWRRMQALEQAGIITGYAAQVDRRQAGFGFCAIVQISLQRHEAENVQAFIRRVLDRPEVQECYATSGETDYHLRVLAKDIDAYDRFLEAFLLKLPGVLHVRSNIVLREIKASAVLPFAG